MMAAFERSSSQNISRPSGTRFIIKAASGAWPAGGRLGLSVGGQAARLRRSVANGRSRRILVVRAAPVEGRASHPIQRFALAAPKGRFAPYCHRSDALGWTSQIDPQQTLSLRPEHRSSCPIPAIAAPMVNGYVGFSACYFDCLLYPTRSPRLRAAASIVGSSALAPLLFSC